MNRASRITGIPDLAQRGATATGWPKKLAIRLQPFSRSLSLFGFDETRDLLRGRDVFIMALVKTLGQEIASTQDQAAESQENRRPA